MNKGQYKQQHNQGRQAREIKRPAIRRRLLPTFRLTALTHSVLSNVIARRRKPSEASSRVDRSPVKTVSSQQRHHPRWSLQFKLPRLPIPRVIRAWLAVPRHRLFIGVSLIIVLGFASYVMITHQLTAMRYQLLPSVAKTIGPADSALLTKVHYESKQADFVLTAAKTPAVPRSSVSVGSSPTNPGYSFQLPTDLVKGIQVTDPVSKLSMQLTPTTGAAIGRRVDNHFVYPLATAGAQDIFTVRANGLQEDIALPNGLTHSLSFSYTLKLPSDLQARQSANGTIGIYSASSALFGNISYGSSADQVLVNTARQNGQKTNLVFAIPAPVIEEASKSGFPSPSPNAVKASYLLKGDQLTLVVHVSHAITGPIVIDPSIVVTSAGDFMTGNNEGDIAINTTNNSISTGGLTGGSISAGWTATTSLPTATNDATSVAFNGYVYEIGGLINGSTYVATVDYAPINSNGTLGSWTATTSLPAAVYFATSVAYNGYLYEIGGNNTGTSTVTSTVDYAPINANGTLGVWTATTSLLVATFQATSVAYNGYLYEIGGCATSCPTATVDYAPINANGTLGVWTATTSLLVATRLDASVVYNGYLYQIGGCATSCPTATVDYAPINANGTIGAWTATTSLPSATYGLTSVAYNGYVYEIGGYTTANVATVDYAPINANGTLGTWTATTSLFAATQTATSIVYNGYLYDIGGYTTTWTAVVDYAPIDPAGVVSGWIGTTGLPTATQQATSVAYNGYLYEIGGYANFSGSQSFGYTGGNQSFTVPVGVSSISVTLYGGAGGNATGGLAGGLGGETTGTLAVTPGQTLTVLVAGVGGNFTSSATPAAGGYGGGGPGGIATSTNLIYGGAGGGGASQILNGTTELAIAGGGAGAGGDGGGGVVGGVGGGTTGGTGGGTGPGLGGTQSAGGAAGNTAAGGTAGGSLSGGTGGGNSSSSCGGGGGGSGYYGGGGGGDSSAGCSGGGGGSALVPSGGSTTSGVESGNGSVTISYSGIAATATVYYAPINSNGTLGAWTATTSLPTATYAATSVIYNGYVYEIGGLNISSSAITTVDYAPINANGTLGAWTATTSLPSATYTATSIAYNGYVYELGGQTTAVTATVDYAPINSNGTLGAWTATTSLPSATWGATSVVYNNYLYEIGGSSSIATVDYAPINSNGTIGAWTATTSLPTGTEVATSVAINGYVYEIGGAITSGSAYTATVDYAPINANGTLGSWTATTSLPSATDWATSVVYNSYLYEIGGAISGSPTATVDVAQINNGGPGTTSAWAATTSLPAATNYATSVAYNGYLYEIGGNTGSVIATVDYAPINANGTIGSWTATTSLPAATEAATSVVYDNYVYEIGGYTSAAVATVDYAPINSNGTLGAWTATTSLPVATQSATSVVYDNYVYEIGGYTTAATTAVVDYAPINSNGTIGSWTATTSLPATTGNATSVIYNGYVYEIGGCNSWCTSIATVDYAPINTNGTLGAWTATTSLPAVADAATSVVYNGYVYELGNVVGGGVTAAVDYAGLQSIPRIGEYSRLLDLTGSSTNDPTPIELLTNGTNIGNPGIGGVSGPGTGGISVNYSLASNACATFSTPNTFSTGISDQMAMPFKLNFTTNGCGTATNIGRYVWVRYTIDDSQTATFPDINGNHTTINDFTVYYHPAPEYRLRGGATFSNGSLQTLDAPP